MVLGRDHPDLAGDGAVAGPLRTRPGEAITFRIHTVNRASVNRVDALRRRGPEIRRLAARIESRRPESDLQPLVEREDDHLAKWRARRIG